MTKLYKSGNSTYFQLSHGETMEDVLRHPVTANQQKLLLCKSLFFIVQKIFLLECLDLHSNRFVIFVKIFYMVLKQFPPNFSLQNVIHPQQLVTGAGVSQETCSPHPLHLQDNSVNPDTVRFKHQHKVTTNIVSLETTNVIQTCLGKIYC